jgi:ABC-type transport system substrate-binding protein
LLVSKGRGPDEVRLVQEVQKQLQEVGVRTRLELLDQAQYTSAVTRSIDETALRLSLAGWLPSSGEARGGLFPLFHSSQWMPKGFNTSFFRNERFDDLLERATRATQGAERDSLYGQAQDLLYEEAPWIFLVAPKTVVARSAALRDPSLTASEVVSVSEKTRFE